MSETPFTVAVDLSQAFEAAETRAHHISGGTCQGFEPKGVGRGQESGLGSSVNYGAG